MEHRKKVKHYQSSCQLHELTFSCYQRRPLLSNNTWRTLLSRSIDSAGEEEGFALNAFVYMPEHLHLVVTPKSNASDIARYLARIKQPFAAQVHELLSKRASPLLNSLTVQERPGKTTFRFWQEGPGFDRNLADAEDVEIAIDYIHKNPVKRKLAPRAIDWAWSSARFYLAEPSGQQFPELPLVTKARF